ncbi:Group IIE secretory phospholipase A2 [Fukomys damarensis]|uniref:Group IIE secretory phospholipase A2 n=1 Tax=Fukomys damarensis TaxID=885580 RepID=A0A091CPP8_FUKDA|nr:Group IIE secretory phospholipase A2 [Fukomys damarensis]
MPCPCPSPVPDASPKSRDSYERGVGDGVKIRDPPASRSRPICVGEREARTSIHKSLTLSHAAGRTTCQRQTCECDKEAALCFRQNLDTFDHKYVNYPNKLCTGPTPPCPSPRPSL